jgi:hypothetical protein
MGEKEMTRFLLALALAGLTTPAFAMMADTMSCADFTAMESADQMAAMAPAEGAMGEGGMAAEGAMAEGGMMAEDMSPEHMTMEATEACEAHPDMTVGDAMKAGY